MLVALGDSVTRGFDGYHDLFTGTYPQDLEKILGEKVINQGVDAASLSGPFLGDMTSQLRNTHFPQYRGVILFYGTNDYDHTDHNLKQISAALKKNLKYLHKNYPKLKIWGVLPLTRYDFYKNDDNVKNAVGFTFKQLLNTLEKTYQKCHVPVLNWEEDPRPIINDNNYKQRLNDSHVHPTRATYQLIAERIAKFIKAND
ncbi:SGNH/GDSL hydrolase family protein [Acetilactobacillus jinshanensis]|uniref:SGNH/GDSL hydrolase family protein n=1 Tax=Acetilactobacillus jinshanensis TaxID=1720083 RepID=A0A4P6ZKE6_9LACO|nr:SGNH/GDSL hydrolase family protein [Acetilactobacillus jinshanensis]QBP17710.1 SGNH/GDSL hydrolase family protein [Acetilactobacillus jinshanensis]URL61746.1 SGNH/GDSL hydrolase family protein [uncultured bacterium]